MYSVVNASNLIGVTVMYKGMYQNLWQAHLKNRTHKQVIAKFATLNEKRITLQQKMKMEVSCHRFVHTSM